MNTDTPTPRTDDSETRVRKNGFSSLIEYCYANDMAKLERELTAVTEQRDRLAEAVNAATILIAAKGRYNTMLAYEGLRETLKSITTTEP